MCNAPLQARKYPHDCGASRPLLVSLNPSGDATYNCGTSFAAPLTAATVATLDQRLARQAPRETLLALPVHRAKRPDVLNRPALRHVARDFVLNGQFNLQPRASMA